MDEIIAGETLKLEATYQFVSHSFRDGEIVEGRTEITQNLPLITIFSKNKGNDRDKKKQANIAKLKAFFDRFFDISVGVFSQLSIPSNDCIV
ncbi:MULTISPECIES: type I restriction endonuclease subunit R, EcoR124 family [Bacteroidales]|uniref:type I restriction endonuclease subunit R, EcoR124 family n=1 Tax=Bacteroidales TaxID=171549 RepID=UPI00189FEC07|nr:hypothetical protein [Parabacteroides distasonis]MDB9151210.1 hypothetical protein [Parabacteroides distasonis]MDB9155720.1 hypothetical protein [Parabacteroides distasonis]MDB9164739.1 hypothetical protein [Parabacteroides distasonis]MDB9169270.1 hypothetical protein [Parabacteroides distasonis]MDB9195993.1 hypothetical protein [Parabacteroides distasonis]